MNKTYPYEKIQDYNNLSGIDTLPKKICDYLLDLPLGGYVPPTDNDYPRVRLMKYLYYDTALPLTQEALTTKEKLSIVYDPTKADTPPTDKGYRVFPLTYTSQAQLTGQTILRCYIGRIIPSDVYTAQIGIVFDILSSMAFESNTKDTALSRTLAIEQCLWESLIGVNFAGIGTMYCDKRQHGDCGSTSISDDQENVGRRVIFAFTYKGGNRMNGWEN